MIVGRSRRRLRVVSSTKRACQHKLIFACVSMDIPVAYGTQPGMNRTVETA